MRQGRGTAGRAASSASPIGTEGDGHSLGAQPGQIAGLDPITLLGCGPIRGPFLKLCDLFGRQRVIERVVDGAQIGIDLVLHVAGKEAELLTRLHRRTREDQALDAAGDELRHGLGDRQIGLARARRTQREDDVVTHQTAHIGRLRGGTRHDRLAAGADHDRRHPRPLARLRIHDAVQRRLVRHGDDRFDQARIKILTDRQLVVHRPQNVTRPRDAVFRSFEMKLVAPRRDEHAEAVFHLHQIGVELSEQSTQKALIVETQIELRAAHLALGDGGFAERDALGASGPVCGFSSHWFLSLR